jgi:hypothetical protein
VERIVHKARNFAEAHALELRQNLAITPQERMRAAKAIKDRMFPGRNPDVREWHQNGRPAVIRRLQ